MTLRLCTLLAIAFVCLCGRLEAQELRQLPAPESVSTSSEIVPVSLIEGDYETQAKIMRDNPMLWRQYQALQVAPAGNTGSGGCGCGGGGYHDRCGCNREMFPWIHGPGDCDAWCVGPKWDVELQGLLLFREDADWGRLQADLGVTPDLVSQFDHAAGARVFVTGYNDCGYGMQVGYMGANDWNALFGYEPDATSERTFTYEARLNSVEVNFLPHRPDPWLPFAGFRYIDIGENLFDDTVEDKPIPLPVSGGTPPEAYEDTGNAYLLSNNLIGFQAGAARNSWQWGERFSLDAYANAGIYCNKFKREEVARTTITIITGDDLDTTDDEFDISTTTVTTRVRRDFTRVAFAGEVGLSGVLRINHCLALRGGYQMMLVDGIGEALDAFFTPQFVSSTEFYHGLQFGLEYQR